MSATLERLLGASDLRGVLIRKLPVRLLEISASGALLETHHRFDVGATGGLRISVMGEEHTDDVRVVRCVYVEGAGSTHRIGVEFLWTRGPGDGTLRDAARRLQRGSRSSKFPVNNAGFGRSR